MMNHPLRMTPGQSENILTSLAPAINHPLLITPDQNETILSSLVPTINHPVKITLWNFLQILVRFLKHFPEIPL